MSNEEEYHNENTVYEETEDDESEKLSKIINTNKKSLNDDTDNKLEDQEDKNKRMANKTSLFFIQIYFIL